MDQKEGSEESEREEAKKKKKKKKKSVAAAVAAGKKTIIKESERVRHGSSCSADFKRGEKKRERERDASRYFAQIHIYTYISLRITVGIYTTFSHASVL